MEPKNCLRLLLAAAIFLAPHARATITYLGGTINLTSSQTYTNPVVLTNDTTISGAPVTFASTVDGAYALSVNSPNTTFSGVVGGATQLTSITFLPPGVPTVQMINTTAIYTTGAQSYNRVILSNSVTLVSLDGGTTSFGAIDSATGTQSLTVEAGGATFNGDVGQFSPPTGLEVNGPGLTVLNAAFVTTRGPQIFDQSVMLGTNVCLTNISGLTNTSGDISFDASLDGTNSLTTIAPGTTEFQNVGLNVPLSSLTVGGSGTVDLTGQMNTTGSQSYNEKVAVLGFTTCGSYSGSFTFTGTVDGPSSLILLTATGIVTLGGAVGATTPLSSLAVGNGANVDLNGGLVITSGAQVYSGKTTLGTLNTILSGSPLTLSNLDGNDDVLTLSNATVLTGTAGNLKELLVAGTGPVALNGTLSATALTVESPATLTGNGSITAPVTVQSGATFAPSLSSGPFTLTGSLDLFGATVMELNAAVPTNDIADVSLGIIYGGTLTVTNLAGTLAAGDSFRLFQGGSYHGAFTNFNLPLLPAGLAWDTRGLTTNGSIIVELRPVLTSIATTGPDTFKLTATGTSNELYNVLASTNIALPLAQWWTLGSATANPSGAITFTDSTATNPSRFYRLSQ